MIKKISIFPIDEWQTCEKWTYFIRWKLWFQVLQRIRIVVYLKPTSIFIVASVFSLHLVQQYYILFWNPLNMDNNLKMI